MIFAPPAGLESVLIPGHDDVSGFDGHRNSLLGVKWCAGSIAAGKRDGSLLDQLIRPPQHRRGNGQAEGLRGLEVDDQVELRGLLHGELGGLRALQ